MPPGRVETERVSSADLPLAAFCIEAVVGTDNEPSKRVAAATISADPVPITDEFSGLPALHYVRKVESSDAR